jgi:hypothetical protein
MGVGARWQVDSGAVVVKKEETPGKAPTFYEMPVDETGWNSEEEEKLKRG